MARTFSTITNPVAARHAVINAAAFASKDDLRPALCQVAIDATADRIRFVSTDSYALLVQELKVAMTPTAFHDVGRDDWAALVGADDLGLVKTLLAGVDEGMVDFERTAEGLHITVDDREVMIPEFKEPTFPDWEALGTGTAHAAKTLKVASALVSRVGALRLPSLKTGEVQIEMTFGAAKAPVAFSHLQRDEELSWHGLLMPLNGGEMIAVPEPTATDLLLAAHADGTHKRRRKACPACYPESADADES